MQIALVDPMAGARPAVPTPRDTGVEPDVRREAAPSRTAVAIGPRGGYGAASEAPVGRTVPPNPAFLRALGEELPVERARRLFRALVESEPVELTADELRTIQAVALNTAARTFTNEFKDDGELLARIAEKRPHYRAFDHGVAFEKSVLDRTKILDEQLDALNVILRTFDDPVRDQPLRLAVMAKLGRLGGVRDIDAVLPHVRRATSPADLHHGQECIRNITRRLGEPIRRKSLRDDPEIGPLLAKPLLSPEERAFVIEAVLERGEIRRFKRFENGEYHSTDVYIVEFSDRLPGEKDPIRAAFKPEPRWHGKSEAYYSREVLVYEFDKRFGKTGLVPPTVEAVLSIGGEGCEVGSLRYWEPRSKLLGRRPKGAAPDVPADRLLPEHEHLPRERWFQRRMDQVRTLAYVFNCDDMIKNNVNPRENLANILVVIDQEGNWDIRAIDWAPSAGGNRNSGIHQDVDFGLLPKKADPDLQKAIANTPKEWVEVLAGDFVKTDDAKKTARRMVQAFNELERRKQA